MLNASKLHTAWRLGPQNIQRVVAYKLGVKTGLNPVRKLKPRPVVGTFYKQTTAPDNSLKKGIARDGWHAHPEAFGLRVRPQDSEPAPPNWHSSVLSGCSADPETPWWALDDFDAAVGDIKGVWEASRFDWVLALAQHSALGDKDALERLNHWLSDWVKNNPAYLGSNWKCGQEASIRVMHLSMAALILKQHQNPEPALLALVENHLQRIEPTLSYAIAQDNNHGTSEAAALFIGGSWLHSNKHPNGANWAKKGRKWLEERAQRLIGKKGSFSQHSINYHRVMLDTYSMAEVWRQALDLDEFSPTLYRKLQLATKWLGNMLSPEGSDTPNLGANDGARLLPLTDTDYRDARPSVQLASVLFLHRSAFSSEHCSKQTWDYPLHWLALEKPIANCNLAHSTHYDDGGFVVWRQKQVMLLLRYPKFRFRPSQSDLLHVDFWLDDRNILRDAGSYSYNCEEPWQSYFPSVKAHNTIEFDGQDQMPRLSRFLFGAWPKSKINADFSAESDSEQEHVGEASYRDWRGNYHYRKLVLQQNFLKVCDKVHGFKSSAVLRWRLEPGDWHWKGKWLVNGHIMMRVLSSTAIKRCEVVEGWESRYYSQKTPLPVLEVELTEPSTITTEIKF